MPEHGPGLAIQYGTMLREWMGFDNNKGVLKGTIPLSVNCPTMNKMSDAEVRAAERRIEEIQTQIKEHLANGTRGVGVFLSGELCLRRSCDFRKYWITTISRTDPSLNRSGEGACSKRQISI
jgi:hypothetical protein